MILNNFKFRTLNNVSEKIFLPRTIRIYKILIVLQFNKLYLFNIGILVKYYIFVLKFETNVNEVKN